MSSCKAGTTAEGCGSRTDTSERRLGTRPSDDVVNGIGSAAQADQSAAAIALCLPGTSPHCAHGSAVAGEID